MSNEINVFEYLNVFTPEQRMNYFLKTISNLQFTPNYWINFNNVTKHIDEYGPELFMLDWLVGKNDDEIEQFFIERPNLLKLIPVLLGIRKDKMQKGILPVQGLNGVYNLDFAHPIAQDVPAFIEFMRGSGVLAIFKNGVSKSIKDYVVGVEAGMDSNGRKNRSGKRGEIFLEQKLESLAKQMGWRWNGQTTAKKVCEDYDLNMDEIFNNRRFDGSLYDPAKKKLYLFEINVFNSGGSKSKAASTEFQQLHERFNRTSHEFIYITDGDGWKSDQSHLLETMTYIGKVFNFQMIEDGFLDEYLHN